MRFKLVLLVPVLAFVALGAWAFASPVGAGPDDDFHLVSTWCATDDPKLCQSGTLESNRYAPAALVHVACFAFDAAASADCQPSHWSVTPTVLTARGNFSHEYPPLYYSVMSIFAGEDIPLSVVTMRFVNLALFIGLTSLLFWLMPARRHLVVWSWLITTMPLGLFLIASNNPSGWAVTGIGTAWVALLGYLQCRGWRQIALGALFTLGTLMAAGSRGDAALYVVGAIGIVVILTFERTRRYLLSLILPLILAVVALAFFATSGQIGAGVNGFGGAGSSSVPAAETALSGFGLLAYNLLNVPFIWSGVFGQWGLGWLDTSLPAVVPLAATAVFVAVGFVGLARMDWRRLVGLIGVVLVLIAIPVYVLTQGGDQVGVGVQPRYILPLIVLLGGLLALGIRPGHESFSRIQVVLLGAALVVCYLVALEVNLRRYVTGIDEPGLNLDNGLEWWWSVPFSPMTVWVVGSIAFAAMVAILIRELHSSSARRVS